MRIKVSKGRKTRLRMIKKAFCATKARRGESLVSIFSWQWRLLLDERQLMEGCRRSKDSHFQTYAHSRTIARTQTTNAQAEYCTSKPYGRCCCFPLVASPSIRYLQRFGYQALNYYSAVVLIKADSRDVNWAMDRTYGDIHAMGLPRSGLHIASQ